MTVRMARFSMDLLFFERSAERIRENTDLKSDFPLLL